MCYYCHIIILFIFVFQESRKQDRGMLADSGVYNELATNSFDPAGHPLCLYGDPAYPLRVHLQAPFKHAVLTQQMEDFNNSMSAVRSLVEWLFSDVINDFKFLDFLEKLKDRFELSGKNVCSFCFAQECHNMLVWKHYIQFFFISTLQIFMIISLKLSFTNKLCQLGM